MVVAANRWYVPGEKILVSTDWHGQPCQQPAVVLRKATSAEYRAQPKPDWAVIVPAHTFAYYLVSTD